MTSYLDSVIKILPAMQAKQIAELLEDYKAAGVVKDIDEYNAKFQELITLVNDTEPKPSFTAIRGLIWHYISSDSHNTMMKAAAKDLESAFAQIDEIGVKTNAHHSLFMQNLIADLERALKDQENTINRLEWLVDKTNEFTIAVVNSFSSSSLLRVPRSEPGAENLYFDNRTYEVLSESQLSNAYVSEHGQILILDTINESRILPISAVLKSDASSYGSELTSAVNEDIRNIVDGTYGTFWNRDVYLNDPVTKVNTVIEFDLGLARDINYMIVEGATEFPFNIESVRAIGQDGSKTSLLSSSVEVDGWKRISFDRIMAKKVVVTFSVNTYKKEDYSVDPTNNSFEVVNSNNKWDFQTTVNAIGPVVAEVLPSKELANILNIPTGNKTLYNAYLYSFSLDNVWFGNAIFKDSGIFVSKPLTGKNFGVIAVQTNEDTTTNEANSNSIEYEIIKKDTFPSFVETKFPIPPLGTLSVVSEKLVFVKRENNATTLDAAMLRFCPYVSSSWTTLDEAPVKVYKNGEELTINTDFQIAIRLSDDGNGLYWVNAWNASGSDSTNFSNYELNPPKMWIKIVKDLDPAAIYTVDYTIRTSDTYIDDDTVWLDKNKTVFISNNGKVYFRRENTDIDIESKIYLQITLRRITASQYTTPVLYDYSLLGATYYSNE